MRYDERDKLVRENAVTWAHGSCSLRVKVLFLIAELQIYT